MRLCFYRRSPVSHPSLQACLSLHRAYAGLRLQLDEELGTHHGIDFDDFVLLHALASAVNGSSLLAHLADELGISRSFLLRRLRPLGKIGLVSLDGGVGNRRVALRAPGRSLIHIANDTVVRVCERPSLALQVRMMGRAMLALEAQ